MRKLTLLLVLAGLATMAFAKEVVTSQSFKRITVEQLEQVLAAAHGKPDAEVAQELSGLELTERLSTIRLSHWNRHLPGRKSERALAALADESAFLDLPPTDIPTAAVPDLETQRRIAALTVDYVAKSVHGLPNFFVKRVTTNFQNKPSQPDRVQAESFPLRPASDQRLKFVNRDSTTVLFEGGQEGRFRGAFQFEPAPLGGLTTLVGFELILGTAMSDAAHSKLTWSHWEQGARGLEAVFRYAVPADESEGTKLVRFQGSSAYLRQIAVDP
jgi:hypothetical protein